MQASRATVVCDTNFEPGSGARWLGAWQEFRSGAGLWSGRVILGNKVAVIEAGARLRASWRTLARTFGHAASQTRAQRCAAHGKRCFGASHRNFGFSLRRVAGGFSHEVCRAAPRVRIIGSGCTGEKPASLKASARRLRQGATGACRKSPSPENSGGNVSAAHRAIVCHRRAEGQKTNPMRRTLTECGFRNPRRKTPDGSLLPGIFISRSADTTPIAPFLDKQDVEISLLAYVTAFFCFLFLIEIPKPRARQYVLSTWVDATLPERSSPAWIPQPVVVNDIWVLYSCTSR